MFASIYAKFFGDEGNKKNKKTSTKGAPQRPVFILKAHSKAEEDKYNIEVERRIEHPISTIGAVANFVKGALGAGILTGHVGYMYCGWGLALFTHFLMVLYMAHNLNVYVLAAKVLYKRFRVPNLSNGDVGETSFISTEIPFLVKHAKKMRYYMDIIICGNLFGSCASYHLIVAKTMKQFVEHTNTVEIESLLEDYPYMTLRFYVACVCIPCVLICMLRHLSWLSYFSLGANLVVVLCIMVTIYYAYQFNPKFEDLEPIRDFAGFFRFSGVAVFSMSCSGVVVPVENQMKNPKRFSLALFVGYAFIGLATMMTSFFGYVAFKDKSASPITINFPIDDIFPKVLKASMVAMVIITHGLNFWVPFSIVFYYIAPRLNQERLVCWEYVFRAFFVILINCVAVTFPSIEALIGVIGSLCISNMAFIWPNLIDILVKYQRPGYGRFYWKLWKGILFMIIGVFLCIAGTYVNMKALIKVLSR